MVFLIAFVNEKVLYYSFGRGGSSGWWLSGIVEDEGVTDEGEARTFIARAASADC